MVKNSKMDKEKIIDIVKNVQDKSNKDLYSAEEFLYQEYEKTKSIVIDLTRHMDTIEDLHSKITKEIENRKSV